MYRLVVSMLLGLGLATDIARADIYLAEVADGTLLLTNLPKAGQQYRQVFHNDSVTPSRRGRSASTPRGERPYAGQIEQAALAHDLPPALLHAVIRHESNYDPAALSPKGAAGLMQLMPGTARELGVDDVWNPAANIEGGARYLKRLLVRFDDDMSLALAAYNAGPGAVVANGLASPPYTETQRYVPSVLREYQRLQDISH